MDQKGPKHLGVSSFKSKSIIVNQVTIVCIRWLKLWKLNYNARNGKYKKVNTKRCSSSAFDIFHHFLRIW